MDGGLFKERYSWWDEGVVCGPWMMEGIAASGIGWMNVDETNGIIMVWLGWMSGWYGRNECAGIKEAIIIHASGFKKVMLAFGFCDFFDARILYTKKFSFDFLVFYDTYTYTNWWGIYIFMSEWCVYLYLYQLYRRRHDSKPRVRHYRMIFTKPARSPSSLIGQQNQTSEYAQSVYALYMFHSDKKHWLLVW